MFIRAPFEVVTNCQNNFIVTLRYEVNNLSLLDGHCLKFFFNPCHTSEYSCCSSAVSMANFVGRIM